MDGGPGGTGRFVAVKFEHPTLAGTQSGGWMTRDEGEAGWKSTATGAILGLDQAPYKTNGSKEVLRQLPYAVEPAYVHARKHAHTHTATRARTHNQKAQVEPKAEAAQAEVKAEPPLTNEEINKIQVRSLYQARPFSIAVA